MSTCFLTDAFIERFCAGFKLNNTLKQINFTSNNLTDLSIEYFAELFNNPRADIDIQKLTLSKNFITPKGGIEMANSLIDCKHPPKVLDMSFNFIKTEAGRLLALAA